MPDMEVTVVAIIPITTSTTEVSAVPEVTVATDTTGQVNSAMGQEVTITNLMETITTGAVVTLTVEATVSRDLSATDFMMKPKKMMEIDQNTRSSMTIIAVMVTTITTKVLITIRERIIMQRQELTRIPEERIIRLLSFIGLL